MNTANVMDNMGKLVGRSKNTEQIEPPATDAPVEDVRAHLSERQPALNQLRGQLDQIEQEISGIKAAKLLGEPIDVNALLALGERRDTLTAAIDEEASIVNGLQQRVDAWDAQEGRRRYDAAIAEMEALSAPSAAREAEFERLAIELVELGQAMNHDVQEFSRASRTAQRLEQQFGFAPTRLRRPYAAPRIPEWFFEKPASTRVQSIRHWFSELRRARPGFAGDTSERQPDQMAIDDGPPRRYEVLRAHRSTGGWQTPGAESLYLEKGTVATLAPAVAAWVERDSPGTLKALKSA